MHPRLITAAALAALALAAACATPAYVAAQSECRAEWMQRLPPEWKRKLVLRGGPGTGGFGGLEACVGAACPGGPMPYWTSEYVDLNEPERRRAIRGCTVERCLARTGDAACDAP